MLDFYRGKRVLITGHTGFKGSWLAAIMAAAGAEVYGYALSPETVNESSEENLYNISGVDSRIHSCIGDIRDFDKLKEFFDKAQPEIVFHLAAQPIVRESYQKPRYTYETNVMGTVNICECVRLSKSVRSFLNVTTDKVYLNREWEWGYREDEQLDGFDPYSNSKSCSELVTHSYNNSFFKNSNIAVSTARAGNVIGGGDFAKDRIIPDCIRAARADEPIVLRNPASTRPFQHVLEALSAYILLAKEQYDNMEVAGYYNVGPDESDAVTAGRITELFSREWVRAGGKELKIVCESDGGPHEANYLKLDCSRIKRKVGWSPKWDIEMAVRKTVEWTVGYLQGRAPEVMEEQIREYFE